jgi:hypothetical protein
LDLLNYLLILFLLGFGLTTGEMLTERGVGGGNDVVVARAFRRARKKTGMGTVWGDLYGATDPIFLGAGAPPARLPGRPMQTVVAIEPPC